MSKQNGKPIKREDLKGGLLTAEDDEFENVILPRLGAPQLDPARRVFTTSEGTEIALRPVRALVVERLANSTAGKPKVPDVEVVIAGRTKRLELNPADEDYLKALKEWEQKKNFDVNFFLFTAGVAGAPPKEFVAEYAVYFPDANDLNLKYLWVCSLVPDGDIAAFIEAVLGQSLPTEKGMQEVAESFRSQGERASD